MADFKRDPEWAVAKRQELADGMVNPLQDAYGAIGLTAKRMARERKRQINAKAVKHLKIKGQLDPKTKLPPGYRIIVATREIKVEDPETGAEMLIEEGETIIEFSGVDHGTRLKAADAIEKNMGWQGADKVEETTKATVIHVHTHIPEPLPLPDELKLPAIEDREGAHDDATD